MASTGRAPPRSSLIATRAFLRQVAEELPSHLPPQLRTFSGEQWGRYYKVWYAEKKIHFEVQFVSGGKLEIGFHLEADRETNERVHSMLTRRSAAIRKLLGADARFGSHGPGWRSLAETWSGAETRTEDGATEAAARLAEYIVVITPMMRNPTRARPNRESVSP